MMDYSAAMMILAIFFWVLLAAAIILLGAWIYIQLMYYHWAKLDRQQYNLVETVAQAVNVKLCEVSQERDSQEVENNS